MEKLQNIENQVTGIVNVIEFYVKIPLLACKVEVWFIQFPLLLASTSSPLNGVLAAKKYRAERRESWGVVSELPLDYKIIKL